MQKKLHSLLHILPKIICNEGLNLSRKIFFLNCNYDLTCWTLYRFYLTLYIHYTTTIHDEHFTGSILYYTLYYDYTCWKLYSFYLTTHYSTNMHVEHFTGSILHYAASYEYMYILNTLQVLFWKLYFP